VHTQPDVMNGPSDDMCIEPGSTLSAKRERRASTLSTTQPTAAH
jgi:hypothetical protein